MRLAVLVVFATIICAAKTTGGSDFIRFDYQPKQEEVTLTFDYSPTKVEKLTEEAKDETKTETETIYIAPQVVYSISPRKDCLIKRFVRRLRRR
jgi:hypothetical protein